MRDHDTPFVLIQCSGGKSTLVDQADAAIVREFSWHASFNRNRGPRSCYVRRKVRREGMPPTALCLHRFLLDAPEGMQVDHINGNPLDNRRRNLRVCTQSQNGANRPRMRRDGYRGVRLLKGKYWSARITYQNKGIHIGCFPTAEDAARAYDAKALELFGEFARLNFPTDTTPAA